MKLILALAATLAVTPALALTPLPPNCSEADGTEYHDARNYGDGVVTAYVHGRDIYTLIASCKSRRSVRFQVYPGQGWPNLDLYLKAEEAMTLADLAGRLKDRGYHVELGQLPAGACICIPAILDEMRVAD